jgi:hypothetical protein
MLPNDDDDEAKNEGFRPYVMSMKNRGVQLPETRTNREQAVYIPLIKVNSLSLSL